MNTIEQALAILDARQAAAVWDDEDTNDIDMWLDFEDDIRGALRFDDATDSAVNLGGLA